MMIRLDRGEVMVYLTDGTGFRDLLGFVPGVRVRTECDKDSHTNGGDHHKSGEFHVDGYVHNPILYSITPLMSTF